MKKRFLCLALAVVVSLACLPLITASALTTHDALIWMQEKNGWYIDFDNEYGGQCVDVVMRYCHDLFGFIPSGDAQEYRYNSLPSGWQRFQYTTGMIPQRGDIVIFQPNWGDPIWTGDGGHVGIVWSAYSDHMFTMEQNTGEGDPYQGTTRMHQMERSYAGVWGFIRPPFSDNGSVSTPTPSPSPADENITLDLPWIGFTDDTNAQIGSFIRNGGATVGCPTFGLQVWEKSTGERIVNHSENISGSVQQAAETKIWVNLTNELGVTLKPGTEYEFQFSATKNGKTYYSGKNTFKTTGTSVQKATGVTLSQSSVTLTVGGSANLTATVSPGNAQNKSVTWTSNKSAVAKVDSNGRVTAVAAGTADITATTSDGGFTASCRVTVSEKDKKVTGVTASKTALTLKPGQTETLTAAVLPADAKDRAVTWTSSNPAVATVDQNGRVKAVAAGSAEITVKTADGGFTAVCRIIVKSETKPESVEVHFPRANVYHQGQFIDVPANQWYTDGVKQAFELGLMKGTGATTFAPNGNVSVAEAVAMAARIHCIYTTGSDTIKPQSGAAWYQAYLDYAYRNKIISDAYYNSDVTQKATRAQFAEIFASSLPADGLNPINNIPDGKIPDVPMSASYAAAVYKLYRAGILAGGDATGTFSPSSFISRAEAASVVSRMAESNSRRTFTL